MSQEKIKTKNNILNRYRTIQQVCIMQLRRNSPSERFRLKLDKEAASLNTSSMIDQENSIRLRYS